MTPKHQLKDRRLIALVDKSLHERATKQAKKEGLTLGELIRQAVIDRLERRAA